MASYYKLEGAALAAYNQMKDDLRNRALKGGIHEKELVIRPLRALDLISTQNWTFNLSSGANNSAVNKTVANDTWIGVHGVIVGASGTQAEAEVALNINGRYVAYWVVQDVNFTQDATVYFDQYVIANRNSPFKADIYTSAANASSRLQLVGLVAERKGITIQDNL